MYWIEYSMFHEHTFQTFIYNSLEAAESEYDAIIERSGLNQKNGCWIKLYSITKDQIVWNNDETAKFFICDDDSCTYSHVIKLNDRVSTLIKQFGDFED